MFRLRLLVFPILPKLTHFNNEFWLSYHTKQERVLLRFRTFSNVLLLSVNPILQLVLDRGPSIFLSLIYRLFQSDNRKCGKTPFILYLYLIIRHHNSQVCLLIIYIPMYLLDLQTLYYTLSPYKECYCIMRL